MISFMSPVASLHELVALAPSKSMKVILYMMSTFIDPCFSNHLNYVEAAFECTLVANALVITACAQKRGLLL